MAQWFKNIKWLYNYVQAVLLVPFILQARCSHCMFWADFFLWTDNNIYWWTYPFAEGVSTGLGTPRCVKIKPCILWLRIKVKVSNSLETIQMVYIGSSSLFIPRIVVIKFNHRSMRKKRNAACRHWTNAMLFSWFVHMHYWGTHHCCLLL